MPYSLLDKNSTYNFLPIDRSLSYSILRQVNQEIFLLRLSLLAK